MSKSGWSGCSEINLRMAYIKLALHNNFSLISFEFGAKYGPDMFLTSFVRFTIIPDFELMGNDKYQLYKG